MNEARIESIHNNSRSSYEWKGKGMGWIWNVNYNRRMACVDSELIYKKSNEEIVEIVKPMMIEHFHTFKGILKKVPGSILSYRFYNTCGSFIDVSLKELGLTQIEYDAKKEK